MPAWVDIAPAPMLSALVGIANAAIFVLIFGSARARLVLLFPAAVLGAFAGQAIGVRLTDPLRIGDFAPAVGVRLRLAGDPDRGPRQPAGAGAFGPQEVTCPSS